MFFTRSDVKEVPHSEIQELFNKVQQSRSIDKLIELQNEISDMHTKWLIDRIGICNLDMGQSHKSVYSNVLSFLAERIDLLNPNFALNPEISNAESANGYDLYDCKCCVFCYSDFTELQKLFLDGSEKTMEYEEFYQQFDKMACTEWSKMNKNGDDWYVGFWKENEGTYERENAWYLTRRQNAQALFDLPYSKTFLLKTVKHGCANRMESVRYSNFLGVWMTKKLILINTQCLEINEDELDNQYENFMHRYYLSLYPSSFVKATDNNMWFEYKDGKWVNTANQQQKIRDEILKTSEN